MLLDRNISDIHTEDYHNIILLYLFEIKSSTQPKCIQYPKLNSISDATDCFLRNCKFEEINEQSYHKLIQQLLFIDHESSKYYLDSRSHIPGNKQINHKFPNFKQFFMKSYMNVKFKNL